MSSPDRIGRFVVTGQAGGGGFATVFRAHDEALQSAVAIKVLAANWLDSADVRGRFLAEARLLRRADSDRVVRVHDVGELPDGRPYLVMTFADRGTLHERLAAGPLPWRAAVSIATEIALGLLVLHDAGILHRDIKPSNVLFRSQPGGREQLLLGDLGLGKLLADGSVLTLVAGTPGYMAPEQGIAGAPVSVRTDVYAVGAVLFRALTGRGPGEPDVVIYPGPQSTVPPSRLAPGIPAELDHVVLRAMARDPQHRHPDIRAFLTDLQHVSIGPAPTGAFPQGPHGPALPGPTQSGPPHSGPTQSGPPRSGPGPGSPAPTGVSHPYGPFSGPRTATRMRDAAGAAAGAGPGAAGRGRRRWVVPAAAGVLALAAAGTVAAFAPWRDTVEVGSETPGVRITVPRGWAGQVAATGWDPDLLGVPGDPQPGVLVAASARDFASIADTRPGAFAGTLPTVDEPTADTFLAVVERANCDQADGALPVGAEVLASLRQTCGGVVLDDVLLRRADRLAWVQVKQPAGAATSTADVVASVRLG